MQVGFNTYSLYILFYPNLAYLLFFRHRLLGNGKVDNLESESIGTLAAAAVGPNWNGACDSLMDDGCGLGTVASLSLSPVASPGRPVAQRKSLESVGFFLSYSSPAGGRQLSRRWPLANCYNSRVRVTQPTQLTALPSTPTYVPATEYAAVVSVA
jgi:hypothetical protein